MSAIPGWYADPAGTDELRFYDGQQWATTTVPRPVPPRAAPEPVSAQPMPVSAQPMPMPMPPAHPLAPVTPVDPANPAFSAAPPGPAAPGGPKGRAGEPFYKKPKVLAGIGAVVVIGAAAAFVLPGLLKDGTSNSTVTPSTSTVPSSVRHVELRSPATLNGWARATDAASVKQAASIRTSFATSTGRPVVQAYRQAGTENGAIVAVGQVTIPAAQRQAEVTQRLKSFSDLRLTFKEQPVGSYGGYTTCGIGLSDGQHVTLCAFADAHVIGVIVIASKNATPVGSVLAARRQIEVLLPGPAPSAAK